jgi:hypothetical protein
MNPLAPVTNTVFNDCLRGETCLVLVGERVLPREVS